jgi:Ca2+:H+ antiporter
VLGTLATLALILPNFAVAASGPSYSILQLEGVGLMSLVLWCVFVFVQILPRPPGSDDSGGAAHNAPGVMTTLLSLVLLVVSLAAVVLLAKTLSYPVDSAISAAGLPKAFVGVVIALIVLMPEGLAAIKSALRNRLQNSSNLALGTAIASIGLTIPTVALVSIVLNRQIALGVSPTDMTLLLLTLYSRVDPWDGPYDRAPARRASRHLRRVHAGVGRALDRARRPLSNMARVSGGRAAGRPPL